MAIINRKSTRIAEVVAAKSTTVDNKKFEAVNKVIQSINTHYKRELVKSGDRIPITYKVPMMEPVPDYVSDGGIPIGRFIEELGDIHSGKTRNALVALAEFQRYCFNCHTPRSLDAVWEKDKNGFPLLKSCSCSNCDNPETNIQAVIDIEGTTDPVFMSFFGIDTNGVIYSRTDLPSQAVGIVDNLLRQPGIGLIIMDSVGAMGSDKEVNTAIEDEKMNQNALFLNKACRKWQAALNSNTNDTGKENGTTLIVINQSYMTLSLFSTEVAQGGRGLRHGKALSIKTRVKELNKDTDTKEVFGAHIEMTNLKNKAGIPYRSGEYYLNLDPNDPIGYCKSNIPLQYAELAIKFKLISQNGGWYGYKGQKWQGKAALLENISTQLMEDVDKIIYHKN